MNLESAKIGSFSNELSFISKVNPVSRRVIRIRAHFSLGLVDLVCLIIPFLLIRVIYPGADDQAMLTAAILTPIYFIAGFGGRAYAGEVIGKTGIAIRRALHSLIVAAGITLFLVFFMKSSEDLSRAAFAIGLLGDALALSAGRALFVHSIRSFGGNPYEVVLLNEGGTGARGINRAIPLSTFDPYMQCPDMYDRLSRVLGDADRVVLDCPREDREAWMNVLKGANVQVELLMPELELVRPLGIGVFGGRPTVVVTRGPLSLPDRLVKRGFDLAIALFAILFLAPVLLLTALAIKLDSRGPVLFVQPRIGRGNRLFRIYKFRSMRRETSDGRGVISTGRNDSRVTAVGRIIRKFSIDELPQLFNVLNGDMSIVGPRPHAVGSRAEEKLFWEIDGRYWHRHAAKPGLTGLAQVRGFRGATEREGDLVNRLQADLEYLDGWSLLRDVKIIAMTFRVLFHSNAF